ncbi:hypothetical protein [Undibacterium rugosum]|uniref:Lipoprotein n=1 Tax=Undibacterium rugosum TaxID=2762291 RepID=A0A923KYV1_9BURK|nr:hypothetical protein [Undibacterium rugosum]MBC3933936.1 hypothetical protein [Undibacterium rugosum]MBR7777647.1 hypothetical protein [Undibacterium rugosum]
MRKHYSTSLLKQSGIAGMLLSLSACGIGSDIANDMGNALGAGIACALTNCKDSADVSLQDISMHFIVTQRNGVVQVDGGLGQSANLLTVVRPSGGDQLSASSNGQTVMLSDIDGTRYKYRAQIPDASVQPVVTVNFIRAGTAYPNMVTLPAVFSIVNPAGPVTLARSAGKLRVQFSRSMPDNVAVGVTMKCTRYDGSSFNEQSDLPYKLDPDAYRIDTLDLDRALNARSVAANNNNANTALVSYCDLELIWTNYTTGTTHPSLNKYSNIRGQRSASHQVFYDARI